MTFLQLSFFFFVILLFPSSVSADNYDFAVTNVKITKVINVVYMYMCAVNSLRIKIRGLLSFAS